MLRRRLFQGKLQLLLQGDMVLASVRVRDESLVGRQLRPADRLTEQTEQMIVAGSDHKGAIGRVEHIKGRHEWMSVADPRRGFPCRDVFHHPMLEKAERAVEHGDVDLCALSRLLACIERSGDAAEHEGAGNQIGHRRAHARRGAIREARRTHKAAHGLDDRVVGRIRLERTRVAKPGRRCVDQPGINLGEFSVREAQPVHCARSEILGQDIRAPYHVAKERAIVLLLQVEDDAFLSPIDKTEVK